MFLILKCNLPFWSAAAHKKKAEMIKLCIGQKPMVLLCVVRKVQDWAFCASSFKLLQKELSPRLGCIQIVRGSTL